jgi:hypothetical protein
MVESLAEDAVLSSSIAGMFQTMQGIDDSKPAELTWLANKQRPEGSIAVVDFVHMFDSGAFCVNHSEKLCLAQVKNLALKVLTT